MAKKKDPTNQDVLEAMNERFNFVSTQFKKAEDHLGLVVTQLHSLNEGQRDLKKHLDEHDIRFDETEATLEAIEKAVDKDALSVVSHERRITRLEKTR